MPTLASSQIFSSIPKQGPALSEAIMDAIVWFQKRSGANALALESRVLPVFCAGIPILHSARHGITQELWCLSVQRMCHHCFSRINTLICSESLLMDVYLMPPFWPVAATIDGICIVCNINMPVLDWMNFLRVHYQTANLIFVWKDSLELMQ